EAEVPDDLDQEPGGVAAGAGAGGQSLLRLLNTRLHADDIANLFLQIRVELDQEIDGRLRLPRNLLEVSGEQRTGLGRREIRGKLGLEIVGVFKRKRVG